jgi:hypothetical protein
VCAQAARRNVVQRRAVPVVGVVGVVLHFIYFPVGRSAARGLLSVAAAVRGAAIAGLRAVSLPLHRRCRCVAATLVGWAARVQHPRFYLFSLVLPS